MKNAKGLKKIEKAAKECLKQFQPCMTVSREYIFELGAQWQQSQPGIKQWVSEWIDVKDRLPESGVKVLCYTVEGWTQVGALYPERQYFSGDNSYAAITHWQHLPEPPNSTTTPKSDMVSKAEIIDLLEQDAKNYKQYGDHIELRTVQDCISKIKEI